MDLVKLFEMQSTLDSHIETQPGLGETDLNEKKILALMVELGELANETRCFKFWSLKSPSARETILEEYVDGIHFILSIGLEGGFENTMIEGTAEQKQDRDLTALFLTLYENINRYRIKKSVETYVEMFSQYLILGEALGFSSQDIENAYYEKNKVNYTRQKEGY
jgi:dimeric dUTPase (all-alpha-NTP-PPase superfamily)